MQGGCECWDIVLKCAVRAEVKLTTSSQGSMMDRYKGGLKGLQEKIVFKRKVGQTET